MSAGYEANRSRERVGSSNYRRWQGGMDSKLLLLVLVAVHVSEQTDLGDGLYIMLRNETTRFVTVRQIGGIGGAAERMGLSSWSVSLEQCSLDTEIVSYSTMDTKRHIFVGKCA